MNPTILEAVDDKHLLGATIEDPAAWRPWRAVLAAAFGLPMDVFTGPVRGALMDTEVFNAIRASMATFGNEV